MASLFLLVNGMLIGYAAISSMDKMWASLIGLGLMVVAALTVSFARLKTKGVIKVILTIIAFVILLIGLLYGLISML